MDRDNQEVKELIQGPITRTRKIKEHEDEMARRMMAFVEESINEGLEFKNEALEDSDKPWKLLMIHVLSREQLLEQVGDAKVEEWLKKGPIVDDRPCTYRPR